MTFYKAGMWLLLLSLITGTAVAVLKLPDHGGYEVNQDLRRELFLMCLKLSSSADGATVAECGDQALQLSKRRKEA